MFPDASETIAPKQGFLGPQKYNLSWYMKLTKLRLGMVILAGMTYYVYESDTDLNTKNINNPSLFAKLISNQGTINRQVKQSLIPQFKLLQELQFLKEDQSWMYSMFSSQKQNLQDKYQRFKCPITNQIMIEPVSLACSHYFQKKAIIDHLSLSQSCPICGKQATISDIRANVIAKHEINRFKKKQYSKFFKWRDNRMKIQLESGSQPFYQLIKQQISLT